MQKDFHIHEMIQSYLDNVYATFNDDIKKTLYFNGNEIYGEILYYSAIKLIKYLKISVHDHFLDIGSGLGKLACYVYFNSQAQTVTGIEINSSRCEIARRVKQIIEDQLPAMFNHREFSLVHGDFLHSCYEKTTIVYICSTIFSFDLLEKIGSKLNEMPNLMKIASFRKLPYLSNFICVKRILIHCSWERVSCYIYERKSS